MRCIIAKSINWLILVLIVMSLAACQSRVRETFDLGGARVSVDQSRKTIKSVKNIQLLVVLPNALKAFDGQEIVVSGGGSLSYLKGAQFGDRLPALVQARLIQAFEDTGQLGGVGRPGEGLAINYQILSDIRSFGIDVTNELAMAGVEIGIKIIDDRSGQVRATRIFRAQFPVSGNNNHDYVSGLERALSNILVQIVNWTFDYL